MKHLLLIFGLFITSQIYANDTLNISVLEAEKVFIEKNFSLLAQKLNIDATKAAIVQAKLWDNPTFFYENSAYYRNPNQQKVDKILPFKGDSTRQYAIQIQQLFVLAGKRNKKVKLEQINAQIAEYQFYDLLRTLKFELRATFWNLYFTQQTVKEYEEEIKSLSELVKLYDIQREKGNIPLTEVIRLKSFLFTLENEKKEILSQMLSDQQVLNTLFANTNFVYYKPVSDLKFRTKIDISTLNINSLIDSAKANRFDLKAQESLWKAEEQNVVLQKSLSVPDLKIGAILDKRSNYINNYVGLQLSMDIPTFNRNQGNITKAQLNAEAAQMNLKQSEIEVIQQVYNSVEQLKKSNNLYQNFDPNFISDFSRLMDGIKSNYEKRNIPLIEFIDYYESFKNSIKQMNALNIDRFNDFERLNFAIGSTLF